MAYWKATEYQTVTQRVLPRSKAKDVLAELLVGMSAELFGFEKFLNKVRQMCYRLEA
jgi:hypothetical protein